MANQSTSVIAFASSTARRSYCATLLCVCERSQMKSPNTTATSHACCVLSDEGTRRITCVALAFAFVAPMLFCSCKTTESELASRRSAPNPYAKNDPKTPEEEAYYRDVYSGNWGEESFGGAPTITKHNGSLTLPEHWRAMPPGAKTLEEIRRESAQRRMAQPSVAANKPGVPVSSSMQPTYGAPYVQGGYPASTTVAPPAPPTPTETTPYANPAAANAYFSQNSSPSYGAAPVTTYQNSLQFAPGTTAGSQYASIGSSQPQYVAQAPTTQTIQTNTPISNNSTSSVMQPQTSSASVPAASNPTPTAVGPQLPNMPSTSAPNVYPDSSTSASTEILKVEKWILRGQEPDDEDEDFATFGEDDDSLFGDSDESDDADSEKTDVGTAEPDGAADEIKPAVEVSADNVNVKATAPEALASNATNVSSEMQSEDEERIGGVQLPITVDPSIAAPYANVNRPLANPSAPSNPDAARDNLDEYVIGGGDSKGEFYSRKDWSIENLDPEDAVAHFDAVDGRILSEPTNRVFIYSPRFGAARQVLAALEGAHSAAVGSANLAVSAVQRENVAGVDVREQETKALGASGTQSVEGAESAMGTTVASGRDIPIEGSGQLRLAAMLTKETVDDLSANDSILMLDGALAAQGWSGEQGVAVAADLVNAFSNAYVEGAATIYHIKDDTKTSKLRIIKIANKDAARSGEFVEFTLRFENIGDEPIGNVTILDNLSARLRYVEGTAQSSMQADFLADLSETGSLVLRWEIEKPLMPKEFGVVRFICKVQ